MRTCSMTGVLDASDTRRLSALTDMFARFDYEQLEAVTRARVLYYMQMGYEDARLGRQKAA